MKATIKLLRSNPLCKGCNYGKGGTCKAFENGVPSMYIRQGLCPMNPFNKVEAK